MGSDQSAGPESNEVARRLFEDAEHVHENSAGHSHEEHGHSKAGTAALALGALGVVYGDIGTSPLYSLKEAFTEKSHIMTVDRINVYGICSLAFWALVIIISIKYLLFVMRADNKGEGGILALTALVMPKRGPVAAKAGLLVALGIFGTALLYGDGIITPAISVLSAVEGLEEVSPAFSSWVIPIAIVILLGLFMVQKRGTGTVGKVFGPIMVAWFATLALLGLSKIIDEPGIIASVNPIYAFRYFTHESQSAFLSLGSIFLVVTGGEALYADMGHFGRRPITIGWYAMVLPSLLLNYWGQGAFLLTHPDDIESVFFRMAPESLL
jgi:KUP system potassium uptake protein